MSTFEAYGEFVFRMLLIHLLSQEIAIAAYQSA
jgi:hypothetical protein